MQPSPQSFLLPTEVAPLTSCNPQTMIEYITENVDTLLQIAASVIAVASLVATLTPNESDNKWVSRASAVVSWLALNVGKAKSK